MKNYPAISDYTVILVPKGSSLQCVKCQKPLVDRGLCEDYDPAVRSQEDTSEKRYYCIVDGTDVLKTSADRMTAKAIGATELAKLLSAK